MPSLKPWFPEMEPNPTPDRALTDVLKEPSAREPVFHRPEFGTSRADFEKIV